MRRGYRARIRQVDVDFLCLAVFGLRYLPTPMAERIAARRELARGLADAFDRHPDLLGPSSPPPLETIAV
jgi:hypothetical protein